jgi:putative RecB family exonuclease
MVKIYSHSKLSTFEQCQLKYKYRYIDKIIPEVEKTIESLLGSIVHETLEWFYNQVKNKKVPTIDETLIYYSVKWEENYIPEIINVSKEKTTTDFFNKGVQFIVNYYMKHQPFNENILELEKEISVNLDKEGEYKIRGFIDKLNYNQETQEYEVHDYKTSNSLPSREKIENDRQLALYSIAIKNEFGTDKNVCLIWHYLAHNMKVCIRKTEEQLEQLKKEILDLIKEIENTKEFPGDKSPLCNWCEYKSTCEEWK